MARRSQGLSRRAGTATEAETFVIVCEGKKTEDIYFGGIRKEYRLPTTRLHVVGLGADPLKVVNTTRELSEGYDHAWAVFDVEAPGPHAQPHARLRDAIRLADRSGILCAISHPCFELWLLLHFRLQTAFLSNEAARAKVRQCSCGYDAKGFDFAKVWPLHHVAIRNALALDVRQRADFPEITNRNPWTNVHELVDQLVTRSRPATG